MTVKPKPGAGNAARPPSGGRVPGIDLLAPIPGFAPSCPVLLLPVRLETRYVEGGSELRIRIYPDQIHLDMHDPALEAAEVAAGQWYWQQVWPAPSADDEAMLAGDALRLLTRTFGEPRARWIVGRMAPINVAPAPRHDAPRFPAPQIRTEGWQRPARVALLPDRWVASAFALDPRGDPISAFVKAGRPIDRSLNASPDPASGEPGLAPADRGRNAPPADPKFRWTTDFAEAEQVGMALRVRSTDFAAKARAMGIGVASPLARLVVWGWRSGDAAPALEALMTAHAHSQGLSIPAPGTPTNLAAAEASPAAVAASPPGSAPPDAIAPHRAGGALVARVMDAITGAATAAETGEDAVERMSDLVWNATLGQTLDQLGDPLIGDTAIDALREHAARWVRPDGPLPLVRIGRQPYGVLPVVASKRFKGGDPVETRLGAVLEGLRPYWSDATARAPKLDRAGHGLDVNLEALLQQGPQAQSVRFRRVLGSRVAELTGFGNAMRATLGAVTTAVLRKAGIGGTPRLAGMVAEAEAMRLEIPWVQVDVEPGATALQPDYLADMATAARASDARTRLVAREPPASLLEALVSQALIYELDKDAAANAYQAMKARGVATLLPPAIALRIDELVNLGPAPGPSGRIVTGAALASLKLGKRKLPISPGLRLTLDALDRLRSRPAADLERTLRGWLDCCSWRFDAWLTSLATRRLAGQRSEPGPHAVQLGGFGWVENLQPDTRPDSEGFVHAPSMHHAQTAALLCSGHLAHREKAADSFAIDLSSRRVREAKTLLDAIGQGVSLGESLGVRFEALLRNRDPRLVKHIRALRTEFPVGLADGGDVAPIDGAALLEARRSRSDWLERALPGATAAERGLIDACAAELDRVFDAVSDLLLAEGVHQIAGGNMTRAAAAFSALDRQTQPAEVEVARTPGSGTAFDQRVIVMLGSDPPPPAWRALFTDGPAIAEPALNAWLARLIGDPRAIAIAASAIDPGSGSRRPFAPIDFAGLGLSPLSLVLLCSPGMNSKGGAFRDIVASVLVRQLTPTEAADGATVVIEPAAPAGAKLGFAEAEALLTALARAVVGKRPLEPSDLTAADVVAPGHSDASDLKARLDAVRDLFEDARSQLAQGIAASGDADEFLHEGIAGALRAGAAFRPTPGEDLRGLAERALSAVTAALEREHSLPERDRGSESEDEDHVRRIRALLGADFPVLPRFGGEHPELRDLWASLGDQAALLAGAALPVQSVMRQMRKVRPALVGVADAIEASELALGEAWSLAVAQIPHRPGAHWIGLPFGDVPPEGVRTSLLIHAPGVDPARPPSLMSGLFVDAWTEVIPGRVARTGVAMHYDAPAARAPQALLLAVHPDPASTAWTPAMLFDSIGEALDLARIRAVRPQDLAPMGMALPLLYLPENATNDVPSTNLHAINDRVKAHARKGASR